MKQINQIGEKMKNIKNTIHPKDSVLVRSSLVRRINLYVKLLDIQYGLEECPTMDRLKEMLKEIELKEIGS
tara:strand:- start:1159 stop:1371 length:213 start_codon:yes stop_codon:yes gene_type:complete